MKVIYNPKTIESALAALSIGELHGYGSKKWASNQANLDSTTHNGILFWDSPRVGKAAYWCFANERAGAKTVTTLDELLVALTEKPKKEPKRLPEVEIFRATTFIGMPVDPSVAASNGNHLVWLYPDGCVQVGCTIVKRKDFERIAAEHRAYMEAE